MLICKNDSKAILKRMFREQSGVDTISYFPPSESINLDWHQIFGYYKLNGRSLLKNDVYQLLDDRRRFETYVRLNSYIKSE